MPSQVSSPRTPNCRFEVQAPNQGTLCIGPLPGPAAERFGAHLRRTLMRQIEGAAASAVRIEGAGHPFAPIAGVVENAVHIVENLRRVRVGLRCGGPIAASINIGGPTIEEKYGVEVVSFVLTETREDRFFYRFTVTHQPVHLLGL